MVYARVLANPRASVRPFCPTADSSGQVSSHHAGSSSSDRSMTVPCAPPTGLNYAVNRYYNSLWDRFLTPDRCSGSASLGNPQSWNKYVYAGNDPINRNDPRGLEERRAGAPSARRTTTVPTMVVAVAATTRAARTATRHKTRTGRTTAVTTRCSRPVAARRNHPTRSRRPPTRHHNKLLASSSSNTGRLVVACL